VTRERGNISDPALLRSALEMASRGWHVFPCATGTKRPALRGNWQRLATTDPGRIRDWWTHRPYNIGISCGPSALVVIDLDVPKWRDAGPATGVSTLTDLCQRAGQPYPAGTFTVATPSGGTHLYFRAAAVAIANSASRLGPLIDIRADGGYVLGPGSRAGGRSYTRTNATLPAPLPAWIARALTRPPPQAAPSPLATTGNVPAVPYALTALREETARVATAAEGTRNDTLNRAAFSLGQLVAGGCLPGSAVISSLADAARESGLHDREATRTINSGMTAGARRPRAPLPRPARQPPPPRRPQLPRDGPSPPRPRLG
jgi:Bifunctional DNA primase/polymerase, N-terminal